MKGFWIIIGIGVAGLTISCNQDQHQKNQEKETEYYPKTTFTLEDSVKTLELTYIMWACECPNWAITDSLDRYHQNGTLAMECFYIEPADQNFILPDSIGYNGDQVVFTGKFYSELGHPKNYPKTEQVARKGRVFRYTSFKVIKSNYRESLNLKDE